MGGEEKGKKMFSWRKEAVGVGRRTEMRKLRKR